MAELDHLIAYSYEQYITLARLCNANQFGATYVNMLNLMLKEQGIIPVNFKHSKLLKEVKKNMISATKIALKRKIYKSDKDKLQKLLEATKIAVSAAELILICNKGIDVVKKYEPSLTTKRSSFNYNSNA